MSTGETSPLFGRTRTVVAVRHALIAPDGHVPSQFPGWRDAVAFVLISPAMGASLSQILVTFEADGGEAVLPADEHEHALYVEQGACRLVVDGKQVDLATASYAYLPPESEVTLQGDSDTRLTLFRKTYEWHPEFDPPSLLHGSANDVPGEPFLGHEDARLQTLFPVEMGFDLAMNIFTYQPGATLPFVETHIMEHGLLMLSGQGVYRLDDAYYPVRSGDAIWMAPYCPQWFVAMGDQPASYLYYKDVHRLP